VLVDHAREFLPSRGVRPGLPRIFEQLAEEHQPLTERVHLLVQHSPQAANAAAIVDVSAHNLPLLVVPIVVGRAEGAQNAATATHTGLRGGLHLRALEGREARLLAHGPRGLLGRGLGVAVGDPAGLSHDAVAGLVPRGQRRRGLLDGVGLAARHRPEELEDGAGKAPGKEHEQQKSDKQVRKVDDDLHELGNDGWKPHIAAQLRLAAEICQALRGGLRVLLHVRSLEPEGLGRGRLD